MAVSPHCCPLAHQQAARHRWQGLALYALDGGSGVPTHKTTASTLVASATTQTTKVPSGAHGSACSMPELVYW